MTWKVYYNNFNNQITLIYSRCHDRTPDFEIRLFKELRWSPLEQRQKERITMMYKDDGRIILPKPKCVKPK